MESVTLDGALRALSLYALGWTLSMVGTVLFFLLCSLRSDHDAES